MVFANKTLLGPQETALASFLTMYSPCVVTVLLRYFAGELKVEQMSPFEVR